jgi:hypothetical protein
MCVGFGYMALVCAFVAGFCAMIKTVSSRRDRPSARDQKETKLHDTTTTTLLLLLLPDPEIGKRKICDEDGVIESASCTRTPPHRHRYHSQRDCASLFLRLTTSFNAQPLETGPAGDGTLAVVIFSANLVFYLKIEINWGNYGEIYFSCFFYNIDVEVKSTNFANLLEKYSPNFRNSPNCSVIQTKILF